MNSATRGWVLAVLMMFGTAGNGFAQIGARVHGGGGYLGIGVRELDLGELNSHMLQSGFGSLDEGILLLGGGGYAQRGRLLIGGEGYAFTNRREARADNAFSARLSGGYGTFNIGYVVASLPRLNVYPTVGLGAGGMSLALTQRGAPTFADVLSMPARNSTLSTGGLMFSAALAADLQLARNRRRNGLSGMTTGVRAGYTASFPSGEWDMPGVSSMTGPEIGFDGFFVTVTIGYKRSGRPAT